MDDVSIADAKAQFAQLVSQAEHGKPVRITRRGRAVAVLISQDEFDRMAAARGNWLEFSQDWRKQFDAAGLPFFEERELAGLRDQSERPEPDFG